RLARGAAEVEGVGPAPVDLDRAERGVGKIDAVHGRYGPAVVHGDGVPAAVAGGRQHPADDADADVRVDPRFHLFQPRPAGPPRRAGRGARPRGTADPTTPLALQHGKPPLREWAADGTRPSPRGRRHPRPPAPSPDGPAKVLRFWPRAPAFGGESPHTLQCEKRPRTPQRIPTFLGEIRPGRHRRPPRHVCSGRPERNKARCVLPIGPAGPPAGNEEPGRQGPDTEDPASSLFAAT